MSRFENAFGTFGNGDSSSEDQDDKNEEAEEETKVHQTKAERYKAAEDSEDSVDRTIKSGKTKRLEALDKILEDSKKHANMQDFGKLVDDFENLGKEIIAQDATMSEEYGDRLPSRVLKVLLLIEETVGEVSNAAAKKFNKPKNVAFTKLKQKFKRYIKETGDAPDFLYEVQLTNFKKNPVDSDADEEDEKDDAEVKKEDDEESDAEEEEEAEDDEEEEEKEEKKEAKKDVVIEEENKGGEDDEYDEEYGEEYYNEEVPSDEGDKEMNLDGDVDAKTKKLYGFLWKNEEDWTP